MFSIKKSYFKKFPVLDLNKKLVQSRSWFDLKKYKPLNFKRILKLKTYKNKNQDIVKSNKIFLFPNQLQRRKIFIWFHIYDYYFNKALNVLKSYKIKSNISLRNKVKEFDNYTRKYSRKGIIHTDTIDHAFREAFNCYKTNFTKIKKKQIRRFRLRKKNNSRRRKTLVLSEKAFSNKFNTIFKSCLGNELKSSNDLTGINITCKLQFDKVKNRFILFVPVKKCTYKVKNRSDSCSLDPGLRTFQTVYSKGNCYKFGNNAIKEIKPLISRIENKKKFEGTKWYKKYSSRLYEKMYNKISDLHWKTIKYLVKRFDNIIVGKLNTSGIVKKEGNLCKKLRNLALQLQHYTFRERLKFKGKEYNCNVIVQDEAYTSKTCGKCGELNRKLGSSKIFNCSRCKFKYDRDLNGARNIMIKYKQTTVKYKWRWLYVKNEIFLQFI